jgi:hypothetical protein
MGKDKKHKKEKHKKDKSKKRKREHSSDSSDSEEERRKYAEKKVGAPACRHTQPPVVAVHVSRRCGSSAGKAGGRVPEQDGQQTWRSRKVSTGFSSTAVGTKRSWCWQAAALPHYTHPMHI